MSTYVVFVILPSGVTIPVDITPDAIVQDILHQLPESRYGWQLSHQDTTLNTKDSLADHGIGPEVVVQAKPHITFTPMSRAELYGAIWLPNRYDSEKHWDVSNITDMSYMFAGLTNIDISNWDVSNVTNMSYMFKNSGFNGDISGWDVSKVTNMKCMFSGARFDGDISNWDVSNVTDMDCMFIFSYFNGDISRWNVSKVTNMSCMFAYSKFNRNISNWDVSNVTNMDGTFSDSLFTGDISNWNISKVSNVHYIFIRLSCYGYLSD